MIITEYTNIYEKYQMYTIIFIIQVNYNKITKID